MNHFECVTPKNNKWYWYLLVVFSCFIAANTIGYIPIFITAIVSVVKKGIDSSTIEELSKMYLNSSGIDLNIILACTLFSFVVLFLTAILFIKLFHGRSWKQVVNGKNRVRWSRFFFGVLVWGAISAILFIISYITEPEVIQLSFQPSKFFVLIIIALLFIPIQSSSEEFLFRGYIAQGVASWTNSRWWALIIPSILFGLLHTFNPEVKEYGFLVMMPQYVFLGLVFGFMSIMDDGIELAMGVHTINNLFGAVLVNYKGAALQTYALFEITEINPAKEILPLVISGLFLLTIFFFKYKWKFSILNSKIQQFDH